MDLAHALHVSDIAAALDLTEQPERQWQIAASSALTGEGLEVHLWLCRARWHWLGSLACHVQSQGIQVQACPQYWGTIALLLPLGILLKSKTLWLQEGMRWLLGHIATQTKKSRLRKQSMKQLKVDSPTTRPQQQQQVAAAY